MKKECIIVGAGTYGEVYSVYLQEEFTILGFIDDDETLVGKSFSNYKVLGNVDFLIANFSRATSVFVPIGNNDVRSLILKKVEKSGFNIPSFIHPEATVHDSVKIGKAVYILPNSSIMPLSKVGDFTMISMGVNIAHHVVIEKSCFCSQGSNIGASITLEEKAYLGIASTIMTGVSRVGKNSLIGAGAVIIRDVEDNAVMIGNPGKLLKFKK